jgi:hypothetical protein
MRFQAFAVAVAAFTIFTSAPAARDGRSQATPQTGVPSDLEIQQAAAAIEQADGYDALLAATERHANVFSSPRVVEMVDAALQNSTLNDMQRGILFLERQLSLDLRQLGAVAAVRLLAVRVIAGSAMSAHTSEQFAAVLEKFSPLATIITVQLVRQALDTPGNNWPKPLLPLMEQLARDWPAVGPLGAATRMAEAAKKTPAPAPSPGPAPGPSPGADRAPTLVGHWRSTEIVFDSPRDEHLVLHANGTAETWIVTASSRGSVTRGRWNAKGTMLSVDWEDGRQWGQPFTFFEGQLVFPNVPNQRQFWEEIK